MVSDPGFSKRITQIQIGLGLAALDSPGYINLGHCRDLGENVAVSEMRADAFKILEEAFLEKWDNSTLPVRTSKQKNFSATG